jgi:hypothetical protein
VSSFKLAARRAENSPAKSPPPQSGGIQKIIFPARRAGRGFSEAAENCLQEEGFNMTKKIIGLVVALVLVLGLGGVLYLLNRQEETAPGENSAADAIYVVGSATSSPTKSVTVTNAQGGFTVNVENADGAYADKVFALAGMETLPAVRTKLSPVVVNSGALAAKSLVSEDPTDLALYGLDDPAVAVKSTLNDGTNLTFSIGDLAPGGEGYYVTADFVKTYLVVSSSLTNFFYRDLDFMDTTITAGDPTTDSFEEVTLSGTVRPEPIVIGRIANPGEGVYITHQIKSPARMDMDTTFALKAIQSVYGLVADEVVAVAETDAVLEQYGLKEPYSTIKVTPPDDLEMDAFTLSASQPDESGNVYLRHGGTKLVYRVAASTLKWLDVQVQELMIKLAIMPAIATLSKVTVQTEDESYAFTLSGEDDALAVSYNGKDLPTDIFRDFYQNLIAASYESVAEVPSSTTTDSGESSSAESSSEDSSSEESSSEDSSGEESSSEDSSAEETSGEESSPDAGTQSPTESIVAGLKPILTYTYTYKDTSRSPDVVRFYPGPARKAYIVVNDGIVYITPITYLDKILADLPKIAAGESVAAYL